MNAARRKAIKTIALQLDQLKEEIETCMAEVEGVKDEEQDAFDNLPESLQETERGEVMSIAIDNLDIASSDLESILSSLDDVISNLSDASGD